MMKKTTEEVVREILGAIYTPLGYAQNGKLIGELAVILDDPTQAEMHNDDEVSPAAWGVRARLFDFYMESVASSSATCNLFYALNRQGELGLIEDMIPTNRYAA